ncbi:substrate-specific activator of APC-dependent proteolysis [Entophlyctis sp. JEL0112]|nr:substrate-specific activator of APC-dependent proteolysis [Entophlyctis sp. JEL0112]
MAGVRGCVLVKVCLPTCTIGIGDCRGSTNTRYVQAKSMIDCRGAQELASGSFAFCGNKLTTTSGITNSCNHDKPPLPRAAYRPYPTGRYFPAHSGGVGQKPVDAWCVLTEAHKLRRGSRASSADRLGGGRRRRRVRDGGVPAPRVRDRDKRAQHSTNADDTSRRVGGRPLCTGMSHLDDSDAELRRSPTPTPARPTPVSRMDPFFQELMLRSRSPRKKRQLSPCPSERDSSPTRNIRACSGDRPRYGARFLSKVVKSTRTDDRAIPVRDEHTVQRFQVANMAQLAKTATPSQESLSASDSQKQFNNGLYQDILASEVLGDAVYSMINSQQPQTPKKGTQPSNFVTPTKTRIYSYSSSTTTPTEADYSAPVISQTRVPSITSATRITPLKPAPSVTSSSPTPSRIPHRPNPQTTAIINSKMLQQPRAILRSPYKVLDAPELQDDFYLNLVDWSATNILAVGLGACVYLWNAQSSVVTKLCDLVRPNAAPDSAGNDTVTGVGWNPRGNYLAVGTSKGVVEVWDVEAKRRLHELTGNTSRVGSIAWRGDVLTTGSRDRSITLRDIRCPQSETKLSVHKQEVCGLKWNYDETLLASGGNDNKLLIWDRKMLRKPVLTYSEHTAAVKAIAWSPHKNGLLASGGGTADQYIRFWNVTSPATDSLEQKMTNSQVCNIAWSKSDDEIVSTHGFSQNQVIVWTVGGTRYDMASLLSFTLFLL